jgi:hypothetical protein
VGLTTFVSTQPAFQQALCASGKMADLASKTQVGLIQLYSAVAVGPEGRAGYLQRGIGVRATP